MKIRRVFWILHKPFVAKPEKKQTDFKSSRSHKSCDKEIYDEYGKYYGTNTVQFAEVISSTITDSEAIKREAIEREAIAAPKHFGTDCIFPAAVYADLQTDPKTAIKAAAKASKRNKII